MTDEGKSFDFTFAWLVPNVFSCKQNISTRSPEFSIDILNDSTFFLSLEYAHKDKMVAITLKRLFKADLCEKFQTVKYKFSLFDPHTSCDMESPWKEASYAEHLACIIHAFCVSQEILQTAKESENELMVKYQIRIENVDENYVQDKTRSLRLLSEDFSRMLKEGHFYDLIFRAEKIEFKVHRFLIKLRAPAIYSIVSYDSPNSKYLVKTVKNMKSSQLENILTFLYCGKLQDASDISQWQLIDYLLRNKLIAFKGKKYLLTNGCIAESSVYQEKIYVVWSLDMDSLNLLYLPTFRLLHSQNLHNESFMLSVWEWVDLFGRSWLRGSIRVINLRVNSVLYARCKIEFFDKHMRVWNGTEACHSFTSNTDFVLPPIVSYDEIIERRLVVDGILKMVFKISVLQDTKDYYCYPLKLKNMLLEDMHRLRETEHRWDLKLVSSQEILRCHRPILMARSPVFRDALMDERGIAITWKLNELYFDDANASALGSFLNYLYTGELENYKYRSHHKLYNLSNIYQIEELRRLCRDSLISGLKLKNVLELLETANTHCDTEMKNQILKFIYSRYQQFVHSKEFSRGVKEKPDLIIEIARNFIPKPSSGYVLLHK